MVARRVALPFVVLYCVYTLVYLSSANAQSERVRAYYASLQPLLRVGLATPILFERDAVIPAPPRGPEAAPTLGPRTHRAARHLGK